MAGHTQTPTRNSTSPQLSRRYKDIRSPGSSRIEDCASPSRQLLLEFSRLLVDQDQQLQNELDAQLEKQAELHRSALAQAAAEHDRIRRNAEIARERVELEIEREKKRFEHAEHDRLEQERRTKVARESEQRKAALERLEREKREHTEGIEEERRIREERDKLEAEKQQAREEAARAKQEAEEALRTRAREAAANAAKSREEAQKSAQATAAGPTPAQGSVRPAPNIPAGVAGATFTQPAATSQQSTTDPLQAEFDDVHKRFVRLHQQLKQMREFVISESKKSAALKTKLGDWRREIVKCMGQLTADKSKNKGPMQRIQAVLQTSLTHAQPSVDVAPYLISVPDLSEPAPMPGVFIYLINIFAKSIVSQFISESSGGAKSADPVGVVAVTIFATPAFKLHQRLPLVDILLAKLHVAAPPLFAVSGADARTVAGRAALGWQRDGQGFIPEQRHLERCAGLSSGWAALTLRDFSRSRNENPLPNWHYWRSIAALANTPSATFGATQAACIKGLVEGYVQRFVGFYGVQAVAVLRAVLVDLPARVRREMGGDKNAERAVKGLEVLREVLGRDLRISFD